MAKTSRTLGFVVTLSDGSLPAVLGRCRAVRRHTASFFARSAIAGMVRASPGWLGQWGA